MKTYKHESSRGTLILNERDIAIVKADRPLNDAVGSLRRDGRIEAQLFRGNVHPTERGQWLFDACNDIRATPEVYEQPE